MLPNAARALSRARSAAFGVRVASSASASAAAPQLRPLAAISHLVGGRCQRPAATVSRSFSNEAPAATSSNESSSSTSEASAAPPSDDPRSSPREVMEYDVVIVGGGPSGLAAAITLKQKAAAAGREITVCIVEKGAEIGSHILSGNVFDPIALDELLPGWREDPDCPVKVKVQKDKFYFLTSSRAIPLPVPPSLHNDGNFIISLSQLTRWLAGKAEGLGVDIFPGFSASELLYSPSGAVCGIATKDVGIGKDGQTKDTFARGMELRGAQTLLAEGTRGSLSEAAMAKFNLRASCDPQTYGLGVKEIWEVAPEKFQQGLVQHTIGWPSPSDTWSGSFVYHLEDNKVLLGVVIGLDYSNTYISPYQELQQFKHHPMMKQLLEGGKCLEYGARVINEGGLQSIPKLTFPGGALIGCSAGFLNVPRIKGSHTAMKSGMLAAEAVLQALGEGGEKPASEVLPSKELTSYSSSIASSWVYRELDGRAKFSSLLPQVRGPLGLPGIFGDRGVCAPREGAVDLPQCASRLAAYEARIRMHADLLPETGRGPVVRSADESPAQCREAQ